MAKADGHEQSSAWLPEGMNQALKRRGVEALGAGFLAVAALLGVALVGYDSGDPSLNTSFAGPISNPLGYGGAVVADVLLQSLGVVSFVLVLVPAIWGWRLVRHERLSQVALRIAAIPVTILLLAGALSIAPVPQSWTLEAGLGGFVGQLTFGTLRYLGPTVLGFLDIFGGVTSVAVLGFLIGCLQILILTIGAG